MFFSVSCAPASDSKIYADTNGYNVFAAKACQCLRALGSVMVLIVLSLIGLTYYTTVFAVYGPLMIRGGNKSQIATVVVILYNLLVRGQPVSRTMEGWDNCLMFTRANSPPHGLLSQVFMLLWSYFAAVLTEPGRVPPGWQPSDDVEEVRYAIVKSTAPLLPLLSGGVSSSRP